jgi:hypothetical protein
MIAMHWKPKDKKTPCSLLVLGPLCNRFSSSTTATRYIWLLQCFDSTSCSALTLLDVLFYVLVLLYAP